MRKKPLTEDQVYKILKRFTLECVHGGDFDQGQSEKDTLSVLKRWWNKDITDEEYLYTTSEINLMLKEMIDYADETVLNHKPESIPSIEIEVLKDIAAKHLDLK